MRRPGRSCGSAKRIVGSPFGGRHRKNTYASETPATDGERLYASFGGNVGVFCYALDGKLLWKHSWAPQPIYLDFGTASSPVVHEGRVYQLHDNDGQSFLAALDAKTGKELWNVQRTDAAGGMRSGWATPFIWKEAGRTEIVTIGRGFVISYDTDGRELWRLKGMTQATPSPVAGDGLLYVGSGSQGEANRPLIAVRPGASGDISLTKDQTSNDFVVWAQPRFSGLYAVTAGLPRTRLRGERQRNPAGRRCQDGRRDLQGTDGRRRPHVLELAACQPGADLLHE